MNPSNEQPTDNDSGIDRAGGQPNVQPHGSTVPEILQPAIVSATEAEKTPEQIETEEIEQIKTNYRLTPKFNQWCINFFDKNNKQTYLNKTQSAIDAYGLDPIKQYHVGSKIGQQNYHKLSNVAADVAERNNFSMDLWLNKGWLKMLESDNPAWWDRIGEVLGFKTAAPQIVLNQNTQNNTQVNVNGVEKEKFNDQFRKWIESQ